MFLQVDITIRKVSPQVARPTLYLLSSPSGRERPLFLLIHKKDSGLTIIGLASSTCCCSVAKSCLTLCDPVDYSMPDCPVLHCPPEFAITHVHWVDDAIQPSHPPLPPPSPPLSLVYLCKAKPIIRGRVWFLCSRVWGVSSPPEAQPPRNWKEEDPKETWGVWLKEEGGDAEKASNRGFLLSLILYFAWLLITRFLLCSQIPGPNLNTISDNWLLIFPNFPILLSCLKTTVRVASHAYQILTLCQTLCKVYYVCNFIIPNRSEDVFYHNSLFSWDNWGSDWGGFPE